jgi:hypothetical protein
VLCLVTAGKNQAMYGTSPVKITFGETVGLLLEVNSQRLLVSVSLYTSKPPNTRIIVYNITQQCLF